MKINGEPRELNISNGYIQLEDRQWSHNDNIVVEFEMFVRKVKSNDKVIANKGKIAFEYGPIVYCAEEVDNSKGVLDLSLDEEYSPQFLFDKNLFDGIGKIKLTKDEKSKLDEVKLIPYFAWANREAGEMAVWLNSKL